MNENKKVNIAEGDYEEFLQDFLLESADKLQEVEQNLLKLEEQPANKELINVIFRAVHTIKGGAAYLGAIDVEKVAHQMESVLNDVRKGVKSISQDLMEELLSYKDRLKNLLEKLTVEKRTPFEVLDTHSFFIFSYGVNFYALPIDCVQEVVKKTTVANVPFSKEFVEGFVNIRGELVPIISPSFLFGVERSDFSYFIVIIDKRLNEKIALCASSVWRVENINQKEIRPMDVFHRMFKGVINYQNKEILVINHETLWQKITREVKKYAN